MSALRIDNLSPGSGVVLDFAGKYTESALFLGITGEKDGRNAHFVCVQAGTEGTLRKSYEWTAYRYNGGWAFGTSAERLRLVSVNKTDV